MPVYLLTAYAVGNTHAGDPRQVGVATKLVTATDDMWGLNAADKALREIASRKVQNANLQLALDNAFYQEISKEELENLLAEARPIQEIALEQKGLSLKS